MKPLLLLPLALALPALAGPSAKEVITPPPPSNCLTTWFAGASVGYLDQFEAPMYNVHVGVTNSCWNVAGFNTSLYAEVGYAEKEWTEKWTGGSVAVSRYSRDTEHAVLPITANVKFERQIAGGLNGYFGGGLGAAWTRAGMTENGPNGSVSGSDSDWVFTAQIFAGLSYTVTPSCEIYGGARWIYYADPTWAGTKVDLGNLPGFSGNIGSDWLFELGARFKF